jgi:Polyketide cyclase / dehydrase and lipid transport
MSDGSTHINEHAPVIARQEILVNAPLDRVWAVHTAVRDWPAWQTDVEALQSSAERLAPGVTFDWTTAGLDIHTTVFAVNETTQETLWGGPAQDIVAVHHWQWLPEADGIRVRTRGSWDGEAIMKDVPGMQRALDASLVAWLEQLKACAEGTPTAGWA